MNIVLVVFDSMRVAEENSDIVNHLFSQTKEDVGGGFAEWLIDIARKQADAPGCSSLAARA